MDASQNPFQITKPTARKSVTETQRVSGVPKKKWLKCPNRSLRRHSEQPRDMERRLCICELATVLLRLTCVIDSNALQTKIDCCPFGGKDNRRQLGKKTGKYFDAHI
ncbi:hypothetical protein CDAR_548121 [Caerostris darwini]|uniref:Uncharacterized protein n=1 Tax=Caerostris darwini TaxID=1538125 RepID=A0AAV4WHZ0_9ARAC|nr:hypothetical protein CDAR_548121 [Caerostris darwini]